MVPLTPLRSALHRPTSVWIHHTPTSCRCTGNHSSVLCFNIHLRTKHLLQGEYQSLALCSNIHLRTKHQFRGVYHSSLLCSHVEKIRHYSLTSKCIGTSLQSYALTFTSTQSTPFHSFLSPLLSHLLMYSVLTRFHSLITPPFFGTFTPSIIFWSSWPLSCLNVNLFTPLTLQNLMKYSLACSFSPLKALSTENYGGKKVVSINRPCFDI